MSFSTTGQRLPNFLKPATQGQPDPTALRTVEYPDQFNAEYVPQERANANPGLAALRSYLGSAREKFDFLNQRRKTPDEMKTQAANLADVEKAAGIVERQLLDSSATARNRLSEAMGKAEADVAAKAGLKPTAHAAEYRARLVAMKPQERAAALAKAVAEQNRPLLAAIFEGDELLTGVPDNMRDAHRNQFLNAVAPMEMALVAELEKAQSYLNNANNRLVTTITRFYEGTKAYKAKQERLAAIRVGLGEEVE